MYLWEREKKFSLGKALQNLLKSSLSFVGASESSNEEKRGRGRNRRKRFHRGGGRVVKIPVNSSCITDWILKQNCRNTHPLHK